ncbi:Hypothetical predicted protein [Olea europaea subsp. europaea]|uniref:Uncharacterized protein n=1 Tax=Olea europaea subsp. europaea TaxID=158383 RepID=A0A8S0S5B5_OLEEU|nr:Hypothetical predicted protein [Olea europaea subsp. europaea]
MGPKANGALELLVVVVGEPALLLGADRHEGLSLGDSARMDELVGGEEARLEDFGVGDDDLGAGTGEDFGVAVVSYFPSTTMQLLGKMI